MHQNGNIVNSPGIQESWKPTLLSLYRFAQAGRCVDGVTHDVNNYLGAAQAYSELVLLEPGLSEQAKRMLGEVVNSIGRCTELVSGLTAISRKERVSANIVDLGSLVDEIARLFQYSSRARRVKLKVSTEANAPSIIADPAKIQWALVFLLWHALDAVPMGHDGTVELSLSFQDDFALLSVQHDGTELSEDEFQRQMNWAPSGDDAFPELFLPSLQAVAQMHQGRVSRPSSNAITLELSRHLRSSDFAEREASASKLNDQSV